MKRKNLFTIPVILLIVMMAGCNKKDDFTGVMPKVTSTNPITDATNIGVSSKISANFSSAMNPSTITATNFTLTDGTTVIPGVVGYADTTATFNPTSNLVANTTYTATITTGARDDSGVRMSKDYTWSFTTGGIPDLVQPSVTLTDPLNNATGISISKLIVITFSKTMDQTTLTGLSFLLFQGTTSIPGTVTSTSTTETFTPNANLAYNKLYTGTVTTNAKDMAGNSVSVNNTFSFTTATEPDLSLPMVNSTSPENNAVGVFYNKVIALTFSEPMNASTITTSTFTLKQGTTPVNGIVGYSGRTATFTPAVTLTSGTIYTATITTGAKDLSGNSLAANTTWSFTTNISTIRSVVALGSAGNYLILAKTAISNISTSALTGDLGLSPAATSYITGLSLTNATGYATSAQVTGQIFAADMAAPTGINLTTAVENMITAYNDAAGRPTPDYVELGTGNIGGKTLLPGLYKWTTTVTMPADVTISGGANDIWIFQISQNLLMSSGVHINLTGGAQAKNIFWQVAGQATLGTTSHFEGILLSMTGITLQTGASFKGRALAQTAVVLDGNTVILP